MANRLDLATLAKAAGGRLVPGRGTTVRGVTSDSRQALKGRLFIALVGDRFDGHAYVKEAFAKGAAAALVSDPSLLLAHPGETFILVDDTLRGLQEMAAWRRRSIKGLTLVAVTGSNGKTTVKEMIGAILSTKGKTLVTQGNLNNHVGLPLTLMSLTGAEKYAVIEMGMNHAGEIARLAAIAKPDIALVTNVGAAHLGHFKNVAAIAEAKGELIAGLDPKATALLNGGDDGSRRLVARYANRPRTFTYGRNGDARWSLVDSWSTPGKPGRTMAIAEGAEEILLAVPLIGAHQADNATAAYAVGRLLGVAPSAIAKALATVKPAPMRMAAGKLPNGAVVINDAYNANPDSMKAALLAVADMSGEAPILLMGEMRELGSKSAAAHKEIGRLAARLGFRLLVGVGEATRPAVASAAKGKIEATVVKGHPQAATYLAKRIGPKDRLLVKGSRGAAMETALGLLVERMEER